MIISRAPVRITLGGGGTDLESYYSGYGGFLISAAIDKYVFICANKRFYDSIRLSYSQTEIVESPHDIRHRIFREALKFLGINSGIELVSIADIPARSGLGTSGAFTVALLNALHTYKKEYVGQKQLAEEAYHIEHNILGEPCGKQDQYIAAYGGVTCFIFEKDGNVVVEPLSLSVESLERLENNLLLFYTGIERDASDILEEQDKKSKEEDPKMVENLHRIKEIGLETRRLLERGDIDAIGELFHEHWETKKKRSDKMTNPFFEEIYEEARENGALGGKIVGAGGGGFFVFYCPNNDRAKLFESMERMGLKYMKFRFDFEGAKILVNT